MTGWRGVLCVYTVALDRDATEKDYVIGRGNNEDRWAKLN